MDFSYEGIVSLLCARGIEQNRIQHKDISDPCTLNILFFFFAALMFMQLEAPHFEQVWYPGNRVCLNDVVS
jgi:hypothetical protein